MQRLNAELWLHWQNEYLQHLQKRAKWRTGGRDLKAGDAVPLKDGDLFQRTWPLGRVEKCYPGQDNCVCIVDVQIHKKLYRLPVHQLVLLPVEPQDSASLPGQEDVRANHHNEWTVGAGLLTEIYVLCMHDYLFVFMCLRYACFSPTWLITGQLQSTFHSYIPNFDPFIQSYIIIHPFSFLGYSVLLQFEWRHYYSFISSEWKGCPYREALQPSHTGPRRRQWHMYLSLNYILTTQYLLDDTLYFRVSVKVDNHKPWLVVCTDIKSNRAIG